MSPFTPMLADAPPRWPAAPVARRAGPWGEELAATRAAAPAEVLFVVPPGQLIVDPGPRSPISAASAGARLAARWLTLAPAAAIAAAEALARRAAPESVLEPVLPALAGSSLAWLLQARLHQHAAERAALAAAGHPVPARRWAAARWIVASRAFGLGPPHGLALVPGLDLLDHADPGNAAWDVLPDGSVAVRATAPVAPGDALRHPYGTRSNLRWLVGWGFVLPDNPRREAVLHGDGLPPVPLVLPPTADDLAATWAAFGPTATPSAEGIAALAARCAGALARLPRAAPPGLPAGWAERVEAVLEAERAVLGAWG